MLGQPRGESGYAFFEVDLGFPAELSFGEGNIQRTAHAMGSDFGGAEGTQLVELFYGSLSSVLLARNISSTACFSSGRFC